MKSENQILSHKLLKLRYEINPRKKLCKIVEKHSKNKFETVLRHSSDPKIHEEYELPLER
jgi:hypothetical protein